MIIDGDRIGAAACKLPLSDNEEVVKDLGTRHRAGVGITEVSDAMVVIVSEENGVISVAYGGALYRDYDNKNLQDAIRKFMNYRKRRNAQSDSRKGNHDFDDDETTDGGEED